jgi:hypothetical protein
LTNELPEGVYIRRATVGEGTEQNLKKTTKELAKELIKRKEYFLNKRIIPPNGFKQLFITGTNPQLTNPTALKKRRLI